MITKEQIKAGLEQGIVRLITDPHMESGTVCAIGKTNNFWFYFGGLTAEELTPEEYFRDVPMEDIIDEIYTTLDDFRSDECFRDEYALYESILKEEIKMEKGFNEEKFMQYLTEKFYEEAPSTLCETLKNIIAYGEKYERGDTALFCYWLTDMIPLLSFEEAATFAEDDNEEKFMQYLTEKFYEEAPSMLCETFKKIIAYGQKCERICKDQFCYWLTNIIPSLSFGEAAMFIADGSLTKDGQEKKAAALKQYLSGTKN